MKNFLHWFECVFAVIGLGLVALFCYYAFPHKNDRDIWEVITAIGTIAAVIVALGIALHQKEVQRQEDKTEANLAAARLFFPITSVAARARKIAAFFHTVKDVDPSPPTVNEYFERLAQLQLDIDLDTLRALSPLEGRCAYKIAGGLGNIETAQSIVPTARPIFHDPTQRQLRMEIAEAMAFQLEECAQSLHSAAEICQRNALMLTSPHQ